MNTHQIKEAIAGLLGALVFGIVFAVVIIEWMAGCGEPTYYADHTWKTNECVFIPYTPTEGTWQ